MGNLKSMNDNEIRELIKAYQDGNEAVLEILVKHYMNMLIYIAKKMYKKNTLLDIDDLIQYGFLGLKDAFKKYDTTRKTKVFSYIYLRTFGEVNDTVRKLTHCRTKSIKKLSFIPLTEINSNGVESEKYTRSNKYNPEYLFLKYSQYNIENIKQHLTEIEHKVIVLYYFESLTLKEIGDIYGFSESRASQLHTQAIEKLRILKNNINNIDELERDYA